VGSQFGENCADCHPDRKPISGPDLSSFAAQFPKAPEQSPSPPPRSDSINESLPGESANQRQKRVAAELLAPNGGRRDPGLDPEYRRFLRYGDAVNAAIHILEATESGLITGGKATVNAGVDTAVSFVTLGFVDGIGFIPVTEADIANGYVVSYAGQRIGIEFLVGVATAGGSQASKVGKVIFVIDMLQNTSSVGRGIYGSVKDGSMDVGDVLEMASGLVGGLGNVVGTKALSNLPNTPSGNAETISKVLANADDTGAPMDPELYGRMRAAFEKTRSDGTFGDIDDSAEAIVEMKLKHGDHVTAATYGADSIVLPPNPTRTQVFEEFIHATQHRTGRFAEWVSRFGESRAIDIAELDALTKLRDNAKAWGIPDDELAAIQARLDDYIAKVSSWPEE
jgi:hypothetical protein